MVEPLEERRLLAFTFRSVAGDDPHFFEFMDADDKFVRVSYGGTIKFRIMWADAAGNLVDLNDRRNPRGLNEFPDDGTFEEPDQDPPLPDSVRGTLEDEFEFLAHRDVDIGLDIFAIDVMKAERGSFISIAEVPPPPEPGEPQTGPRPMDPWGGTISDMGVFTVNDGESPGEISPPSNSGGVYIGARVVGEALSSPFDNRPFAYQSFFTVAAPFAFAHVQPGELMAPGLYVDRGQTLSRFLLGGAITGRVDIGGSMDLFYAGWIITGSATGTGYGVEVPSNFRVRGDLHSLVTAGPIGTDGEFAEDDPHLPHYLSGVEIDIRGNLGQILSKDDVIARVLVRQHRSAVKALPVRLEVEHSGYPYGGDDTAFQIGLLGGNVDIPNDLFRNDTFDDPEYLGTINKNGRELLYVDGSLNTAAFVEPAHGEDFVDYYGLAMLAGQTVNIRLIDNGSTYVGIFDPDGRLIATDHRLPGQEFKFTADRPGVHRIAVATPGDLDFNGAFNVTRDNIAETITEVGTVSYRLMVKNAGDLSFGGLSTTGVFLATGGTMNQPTIEVRRGDFGSLFAGENVVARQFADGLTMVRHLSVRSGNLRSIESNQIGWITPASRYTGGINLGVPRGSVGLVRAGELLILNPAFGLPSTGVLPVGRDYQLLDVPGGVFAGGNVIANGGIGIIRAGEVASDGGFWNFTADADRKGRDGIIDLIDVAGDFGTLAGGPAITTGPGGNVRYIHVAGEAFQDRFFGGGSPIATELEEGESYTVFDDSGSEMIVAPSRRRNPNFGPNSDPTQVEPFIGGTLTLRTYAIRSGGVVLMDARTTESLSITASGRTAEVGRIFVEGDGNPVTTNAESEPNMPTGTPLNIEFRGSARLDVLYLGGDEIDGEAPNFTRITNRTTGELVNVDANSIGLISAHTIGLARNHTGAAVNPILPRGDGYPFWDQRIGIVVGEPDFTSTTYQAENGIVRVHARQGVGNFFVEGAIGELLSNDDGDTPGAGFEGINAPVFSNTMHLIDIGEGILPSGSGAVSFAGLYSRDIIRRVVNQGPRSDIRGDIVAADFIESVRLRNGSIIGADIMAVTNLAMAQDLPIAFTSSDTRDDNPISEGVEFEIGEVVVDGFGGIIGARFVAADIDTIQVGGGGFGIFSTFMTVLGEGEFVKVRADGYGMRGVSLQGGADAGLIEAFGNGKQLSTAKVSRSVRLSERGGGFDPFFGTRHSELTDIHFVLGTSKRNPIDSRSTRKGMIENSTFVGQRNLDMMKAFQIRDNTVVNFANRIDRLETVRGMDTLSPLSQVQVTTGSMGRFQAGGDIGTAHIIVRGPLRNMVVRGDVGRDTQFVTEGPDGFMENVKITRSLRGTLRSVKGMGVVTIGRDLIGTLDVRRRTSEPISLQKLVVGRHIRRGTLQILGNAGKIIVRGDIRNGGLVRVRDGDVNLLRMRNLAGAVQFADGSSLKRFEARGSIQPGGIVEVDQRLGVLRVGGDLEEDALVTADELGKERVAGDIFGDIIIG